MEKRSRVKTNVYNTSGFILFAIFGGKSNNDSIRMFNLLLKWLANETYRR